MGEWSCAVDSKRRRLKFPFSARRVIVSTFGILAQRSQILQNLISIDLEKAAHIVTALLVRRGQTKSVDLLFFKNTDSLHRALQILHNSIPRRQDQPQDVQRYELVRINYFATYQWWRRIELGENRSATNNDALRGKIRACFITALWRSLCQFPELVSVKSTLTVCVWVCIHLQL